MPTTPPTPIAAAILAGGASTRMGQNKALLRLTPNSSTLIETVVSHLAEAGYPTPLLITNTPTDYSFLKLPTSPDIIPGKGPLGGILTALTHFQNSHTHALIVACDMPTLNPALLRYMSTLPRGYDAYVPSWQSTANVQQVEPLHAIYATPAIPKITAQMAQERLKLGDLLRTLNIYYIPESDLRQYDQTLQSFRNINTPEEWHDASKRK